MWSALENAALRESLPTPLKAGDSIHDILIAGQLDRGRYTLHHLGRRRSRPYLLKQFYSINTDAFLRWQNAARFMRLPETDGFIWPCEEWRGGVISQLPGGTPLDTWLARGPHSDASRLGVAASLAHGLARLHRSGIRHRNLSPDAVWVHDGAATITDFGAARCDWWDDLWTDSAFTATCVEHASPESLRGRQCDQAHDVYAFGALLHLLLSGRSAFGALKRLLRPVMPSAIPPAPLAISGAIPPQIRELAKACLATEPDHRPTATEAATVLEVCCTDNQSVAEDIDRPRSDSSAHRRQRVMAFVKDDSRAVALFDAALRAATDTPSLFLFVSLIPGNLPSGHLERFKGNLFRKLGQGLLRCREAGLQWSVRALQCPDIDKTAAAFVKQYAPDTLFLGSPEKRGKTDHDFGKRLSAIHDHIRHCA